MGERLEGGRRLAEATPKTPKKVTLQMGCLSVSCCCQTSSFCSISVEMAVFQIADLKRGGRGGTMQRNFQINLRFLDGHGSGMLGMLFWRQWDHVMD